MPNMNDSKMSSAQLERMSSAAITDYISSQRAILIKNLTYQKKYLTTLIHEREVELKILSDMAVVKAC